MKTYLQLMYKSFYDIKFINNFIRKHEGTGTAFLALLSAIIAAIWAIVIIIGIKSISIEEINEVTAPFFDRFEEIVIKNGELQWQDGVIEKFNFNQEGVIIVDTINKNPNIMAIKEATIYITKTSMFFNDNNKKIQELSFSDIQTLLKENPLKINQEAVEKFIKISITYIIGIVIVFMALFYFPLLWLVNIILAFITCIIGMNFNKMFKNIDFNTARRMAVVSVTPLIILVTLSDLILGIPGIMVRWVIVIVTGGALMNIYVKYLKQAKEGANTKEVSYDEIMSAKLETAKKASKPAPKKKAPAKKPAVKTAAKPAAKKAAPKKASAKK